MSSRKSSKNKNIDRRSKKKIASNLLQSSDVIRDCLRSVLDAYTQTGETEVLHVTEAYMYADSLQKTLTELNDIYGRSKTISE